RRFLHVRGCRFFCLLRLGGGFLGCGVGLVGGSLVFCRLLRGRLGVCQCGGGLLFSRLHRRNLLISGGLGFGHLLGGVFRSRKSSDGVLVSRDGSGRLLFDLGQCGELRLEFGLRRSGFFSRRLGHHFQGGRIGGQR